MPDFIVDGTRLRYELTGEKGPVIVFLNGIAMTIGHWKPVIQAMGEGFRCLCHDFRGQTLSDMPSGPYSFELHGADSFRASASSRVRDTPRSSRCPGA